MAASYSRRIDFFEFDVAPDEELPDYEPNTAPQYAVEDFATPLHTYSLRQVDRKLQLLVPFGPSPAASYKIINQGSFRLFSKKPDIQMMRESHGPSLDQPVVSIRFNTDGPLPWRPRAQFTHTDSHGTANEYAMESRNFADWAVSIGGITFFWRLEGRPVSLVLSEKNASMVIARFTYSGSGTMASGGAEVGDLTIYRDGLSIDQDGVERIISGLMVVVVHYKRMGRHYWNDGPLRVGSLDRTQVPPQNGSIASHSTL
ncbi:hypothetical protein EJ04DRAFT_515084 [Polyplosphaeria fusca]|uniref:Uncharacterized protein n=1 Tax=Polyplosphaeria fusca TaxID=682080 RepID=A0A9P4QNK0_9PLEO|nr:hypothetical protein EJ04DRAFT_515084 [Polyplosphaeria fusca]